MYTRWTNASVELHGPRISNARTDLQRGYPTHACGQTRRPAVALSHAIAPFQSTPRTSTSLITCHCDSPDAHGQNK